MRKKPIATPPAAESLAALPGMLPRKGGRWRSEADGTLTLVSGTAPAPAAAAATKKPETEA